MSEVSVVTEGFLEKKGIDDGLYEVKTSSWIVLQCGVLWDCIVWLTYLTKI
jgi:hypothetical protein